MVRGEEFPGNGKKGGRFAYAFIGLCPIFYLSFVSFCIFVVFKISIGKLKFGFRGRILIYITFELMVRISELVVFSVL